MDPPDRVCGYITHKTRAREEPLHTCIRRPASDSRYCKLHSGQLDSDGFVEIAKKELQELRSLDTSLSANKDYFRPNLDGVHVRRVRQESDEEWVKNEYNDQNTLCEVKTEGISLQHATFKGIKLDKVDFAGSDLSFVDFVDCDGSQLNFRHAEIEDARFRGEFSEYNYLFFQSFIHTERSYSGDLIFDCRNVSNIVFHHLDFDDMTIRSQCSNVCLISVEASMIDLHYQSAEYILMDRTCSINLLDIGEANINPIDFGRSRINQIETTYDTSIIPFTTETTPKGIYTQICKNTGNQPRPDPGIYPDIDLDNTEGGLFPRRDTRSYYLALYDTQSRIADLYRRSEKANVYLSRYREKMQTREEIAKLEEDTETYHRLILLRTVGYFYNFKLLLWYVGLISFFSGFAYTLFFIIGDLLSVSSVLVATDPLYILSMLRSIISNFVIFTLKGFMLSLPINLEGIEPFSGVFVFIYWIQKFLISIIWLSSIPTAIRRIELLESY